MNSKSQPINSKLEVKNPSISDHLSLMNIKIAHDVFMSNDKNVCQILQLRDVIIYYKNIIALYYPDQSLYNIGHIIKIILSYLDVSQDSIDICTQLPPTSFIQMNGYKIVGDDCLIYKKPLNGNEIVELTKNDSFHIGRAVKSHDKEISRKKNRYASNRDVKTHNFILEQVQVRDKQGRYSNKTSICINKPIIPDNYAIDVSKSYVEQDILYPSLIKSDNDILPKKTSDVFGDSEYNGDSEYVYIFHPREFAKNGENIYKIGRTKQCPFERIKSYDKGTRMVAFKQVINCNKTERCIIREFSTKFIRRTDLGNELFQGDKREIVKLFDHICNKATGICMPNCEQKEISPL